jgi:hypothetical protein
MTINNIFDSLGLIKDENTASKISINFFRFLHATENSNIE